MAERGAQTCSQGDWPGACENGESLSFRLSGKPRGICLAMRLPGLCRRLERLPSTLVKLAVTRRHPGKARQACLKPGPLCDTTEKIILSPKVQRTRATGACRRVICSRREAGRPSESGVRLRNCGRRRLSSQEGCPMPPMPLMPR